MSGWDDISTLQSRWNLACVLCNQYKYLEAEKVLQLLLKSKSEALGPKHADTLEVIEFLTSTLEYQGKSQAAKELSQRTTNDDAGPSDTMAPEDQYAPEV